MAFKVSMAAQAEADLDAIYDYIATHASPRRARAYVDRLLTFLSQFDTFPQRGSVRADLRDGLRIVGFERRVSVAFVVETDTVVILRILYAGRSIDVEF
jgi:plasmid stabilization system protein ParE